MPRPREPPVFFIDHCLGRKLVVGRLKAAGADARALVDEGFSENAEDVEWLPIVASRGWAIVTKDKRIGKRPLEREAIISAGGGAFIVAMGRLKGIEVADLLAGALPKMLRIWANCARPFIAVVLGSGVVEIREGGARLAAIRRD